LFVLAPIGIFLFVEDRVRFDRSRSQGRTSFLFLRELILGTYFSSLSDFDHFRNERFGLFRIEVLEKERLKFLPGDLVDLKQTLSRQIEDLSCRCLINNWQLHCFPLSSYWDSSGKVRPDRWANPREEGEKHLDEARFTVGYPGEKEFHWKSLPQ